MSLSNAPLLRIRSAGSPPGGADRVVVTYLVDEDHLDTWPPADIASIDLTMPDAADDQAPGQSLERIFRAMALLPEDQPWDRYLRLRISDPELAGLPWESLGPTPNRRVIRYSPRPAAHAYEPIQLPLSILFADSMGDDDRESVATEFFRTVRTAGQSAATLLQLISAGQHDIVHLTCLVASGSVETDRVSYPDGSPVDVGPLRRALRSSRTRLLVLEEAPNGPREPTHTLNSLRTLAHRLHGASGVSVIATPAAHFSDFYRDLTHDYLLSGLVSRIVIPPAQDHPAIWLRQGADSALRLLAPSARVAASVVREHRRLHAAQAAQEEISMVRGLDRFGPATTSALREVDRLRDLTYSFDREAYGYLPMTSTEAELRSLRETRALEIPEPGRVMNTWLEKDGRAIPSSTTIAGGTVYELVVGIGSHDPRSATSDTTTFDESAITNYDESGLATLEIIVSSTDFTIERPRQTLHLPPPPDDSHLVRFTAQAPAEPGTYRLRVGVYHQTNLIQSLLLTATVTADEEPDQPTGYRAVLEWALSSSLRNLDDFAEPALNILTNEAADGTHTFVLVGTGTIGAEPEIHKQLDLPADQLKSLVDDVRSDLQGVCSTLRNGRLDRYRFDRDNRGSRQQFVEDLRLLALGGSGLFVQLTTGSDATFNEQLETRLRGSRLIQIASVRSANYVYPWSLVYDHEFRDGRSTVLCESVGRVLDARGSVQDLITTPCFAVECPERDNPRVVCPSGFWGFRHVIEQPLLTPPALEEPDDGEMDDTRGTPRHDVVTTIPLRGASTPEVVIGVSEALSDWSRHSEAAARELGGSPAVHSSIDDLLTSLVRLDLHLAYFYCHGGRKGSKPFLGLGTSREEEALFPQYLKDVTWPAHHPFVFINGCQTVGITPDDLLTFNRMLARAEASGVLGTEISIPERLAQPVALELLKELRRFEPVGHTIRRIRLGLLTKLNPLGLAYTPYCMASLRLTPG